MSAAKKDVPSLSDLTGKKKDTTTVAENKATSDEKTTPPVSSTIHDHSDDRDLPIGPDSNKDNVIVKVDDSTLSLNDSPSYKDYNNDEDKADTWNTSPSVTALRTDKTPAELSSETPDETAARYGVDTTITDEMADNPNIQLYRDTHVNQVPSGTHLHPDIAKDLLNRGISEQHTDNAQVKRTITEAYAFAPDAEQNDKF
jgi:hypothetical protein